MRENKLEAQIRDQMAVMRCGTTATIKGHVVTCWGYDSFEVGTTDGSKKTTASHVLSQIWRAVHKD